MLKHNEEGRIGEEVLVVTATLTRIEEGEEGERAKHTVLVKPTVLVKLDEAMGRRNKGGMRGLGEWAGSFFGGGIGPPPPPAPAKAPVIEEAAEENKQESA